MDPSSEMGPLVTRGPPGQGRVAISTPGAEQGAKVLADGRETAPEGDGFFLGVSLLDDVTTEMDAYRDEIFGPVLGGHARRHLRRGAEADQRQPVRERHRDLHAGRRRRTPVPVRRERRHGRHQRADPGAGRLLLLRRLEGVALRRQRTSTGPRESTSTPAARSSRAAGPIRPRARSTSASRKRARNQPGWSGRTCGAAPTGTAGLSEARAGGSSRAFRRRSSQRPTPRVPFRPCPRMHRRPAIRRLPPIRRRLPHRLRPRARRRRSLRPGCRQGRTIRARCGRRT